MLTTQYLKYNLLATAVSFLIGLIVFYLVDEKRYISYQLAVSLLFSIISLTIFLGLKLTRDKKDAKAIGISMMQSLVKLLFSLALLIPFYLMYCPVDNYYLLNFIITYLIFMGLDTYILSNE